MFPTVIVPKEVEVPMKGKNAAKGPVDVPASSAVDTQRKALSTPFPRLLTQKEEASELALSYPLHDFNVLRSERCKRLIETESN